MRYLLVSFFCGLLYPLAFAPFEQGWSLAPYLIFFLIAAFFGLLLKTTTARQSFYLSWLFGTGIFLSGVSWVYVAIHDFGGTPWWLAGLFTLLFILALGLFFGFQGLLSHYLARYLQQKLQLSSKMDKHLYEVLCLVLLFPLLWLCFEWLRSWLFTGFPWLLAGYSQLQTPLAGWAPVLGIYGMGLLVSTLAALLLLIFRIKSLFSGFGIGLLMASIFILGQHLKTMDWSEATGEPVRVAMVQGNISQQHRWDRSYLQHIKRRYLAMSAKLWANYDLLVWPENAIPVFYQREQYRLFRLIRQQLKKHQNNFVTGVPYWDEQHAKYYNSLLKLDAHGEQFYFKQHLVPFGEYLPLQNWLRGLINFFNIPMSGFSLPPPQKGLISIKNIPLAVSLCYEDIFPQLIRRQLPQAQLLLNLSNNGWYGNSLAPHQHLQIARMRALESGRDLIRSTTSGISALINYKGEIIAQGAQFKPELVQGQVQPRRGSTFYVKYGHLPVIIYAFFSLCVIVSAVGSKTFLMMKGNKK